MSDIHDDTPTSEELAADIGETEGMDAEQDDGLGPIDALIAERDQWKDRALRAVAEAENTKKRAETSNNDARAYAIQKFARDLLGVADNLERALQAGYALFGRTVRPAMVVVAAKGSGAAAGNAAYAKAMDSDGGNFDEQA